MALKRAAVSVPAALLTKYEAAKLEKEKLSCSLKPIRQTIIKINASSGQQRIYSDSIKIINIFIFIVLLYY